MWLLGTLWLSLIRKLSSRCPADSAPTVTYRTPAGRADTALRSTLMLPILNQSVTNCGRFHAPGAAVRLHGAAAAAGASAAVQSWAAILSGANTSSLADCAWWLGCAAKGCVVRRRVPRVGTEGPTSRRRAPRDRLFCNCRRRGQDARRQPNSDRALGRVTDDVNRPSQSTIGVDRLRGKPAPGI